ncbi:alpha/beta fold hydrolase [Stieleria sp. TO1_6]|uniref:YheT family hydrolase n=1 Tax=Stieleria tagensis TaxID=2956795 RepID=UPI00209A742C|nr:alpha/beta fold hydrolase [Stieleria tagensis]MCO8124221.1 alpha/beta fold hydrolase [Stieleria tagensis]
MDTFSPPPFLPDRLIRGGHLQTIASLGVTDRALEPTDRHIVRLPDGDAIVLHENRPVDGGGSFSSPPSNRSMVLFHGLSGCHGSPYMIRIANRLVRSNWTVYRVDMRGCGAARDLASGLSHAGRSEDVYAALDFVARRNPHSRLSAAGVSLGGNQLLRFAGRIGAGLDARPHWWDQMAKLAVVAPPIDLVRCSENMQRFSRRIYNYYFIRTLFDRIAPGVRRHAVFQQAALQGRPKTLFELDDRITAPISGFADAPQYYRDCGAIAVAGSNQIPTLVLAAKDDPIVPIDCFERAKWPDQTQLVVTRAGGHAGFIARGRSRWMDDCLVDWANHF